MGIMKLKSWMSFALLIFLLAIMACEGSSGSGYPYSGIFFSNNYDTGTTPVVAGVEKTNIIIEVHDSPEYDLYYHVATADLANNRVNWGPSHVMGISGGNPSVAVSETGVVAEAHEVLGVNSNNGNGHLETIIGIADVNSNQIGWGPAQQMGNSMYHPSICITRDSKTAILIYQDNDATNRTTVTTLWYRVGAIDVANKTVSWGTAVAYDQGIFPSIAINNKGHIITVHSSWQANTALWYKVGQLNANSTIDWGGTSSFNEGEIGAKVSISDDPGDGTGSNLMLVYPGRQNNGALWLSLGALPTGSYTAQWPYTAQYGSSSQDVMPACTYAFNKSMVEVHDGSTLNWKLWYGFAQ
jgi:hypothetical protein